MNKFKKIFRIAFITIVVTASLWALDVLFYGLNKVLNHRVLFSITPLIYIVTIWKAFKWSSNEFDNHFNNPTSL